MDASRDIIIAVGCDDDHNFKIMRWGLYLAEQIHGIVHLVHVIPKYDIASQVGPLERPLIGYDDFYVSDELVQSDWEMGEVRLSQLSGEFNVPKERCHLLSGETVTSINEFIAKFDPVIIVAGIRENYNQLLAQFSSEVLRMISTIEAPFLLVPESAGIPDEKSMHLLFANDMRSDSEIYLEDALDWAQRLHASTFTTLHVLPEPKTFDRFWRSIFPASHKATLENHEAKWLERAKVKAGLRTQIARCIDSHRDRGLRVNSMALEGKVKDEISFAVRRTLANIVILGRHSFFHMQDSSFGNLPYSKVGEFGVPTLICKQHFEEVPLTVIRPSERLSEVVS